ncbi:MAG: hypothetical protein AB8F26_06960 [Phycisphaerales bacterium]
MAKRKHGPKQITDFDLRRMVVYSQLKHRERSTLLIIAHCLYRDSLKIVASYQRIGDYLGLSRRQAITRMQALEDLEVLVKIREGGGHYQHGGGRCNAWQLDLEMLRFYELPPTPKANGEADFPLGVKPASPMGEVDFPAEVKPTAHDPMHPMNSNALSNNPPNRSAGGARGGGEGRGRSKIPNPRLPRFKMTEGTRADRVAELRAQKAIADKQTRDAQSDPVQLDSEGGNSDRINRE